jgi:Flp pilus assembly protein TadG
MKLFRNEEGQTLVITALLMCILMGFMALAIDMGVTFKTQRRVQTQADAAVIAAALCATYGGEYCTRFGGTDVTSVATGAANANGMASNATISVTGAVYGQHLTGYYEAIIKQPSASPFVGTFAGLFAGGSAGGYNPMSVGARAVAGLVPGTTCLYVLNKTADKSLYVKGAAQITAPHCSIQVNSDSPSAVCTTGNSATIDSGQILVVGSQGSAGNCNQTQSNVQSGGGSANDPLADMKMPDQGCNTDSSKGPVNVFGWGSPASVTVTLTQSGSTITLTNTSTGATQTVTTAPYSPGGTGTPAVGVACFSDTNVQLTSDLGTSTNRNTAWVFQHGLNVAGNTFLTINGTTEIQGGDFKEANTNLFINGPTLDASVQPYTAMALLVPSTGVTCPSSITSMGTVPAGDGCLNLQFGSGGSPNQLSNKCSSGSTTPGIVGTVYAPKDVLYMQDNGGCLSVTNIIADEVWNKSGDLEIYNYNLAYTTSPLDVVRLVE